MGDDGLPRTVTPGSLAHGNATMYRISPLWEGARPFTVNGAHILVLVNNNKPRVKKRTTRLRNGDVSFRWRVLEWELTTDNRMVDAYRGQYDTKELAEAKRSRILAAGWEPLEWEVSVEEYLAASGSVRHSCKLIACDAITFSNPQLPSLHHVLTTVLNRPPTAAQIEYMAWWLGMWVTDGISRRASVCQGGAPPPDPHHHHHIFARLRDYQQLFNWPITQTLDSYSTAGWPLYCFNYGAGSVADRVLRAYGLLNNKHVPRAFICDSLDVRRRFMAGLIDGDGYYSERDNTYEIQAKHYDVIAGYKELAATLGLRNSRIQQHECTNQQTGETYLGHRIVISGYMWVTVQHCVATYKQCPQPGTANHVEKNKDSLCYGFDITELDDGDYFGFAVHGGVNRRFLLEDYTVTHNVSQCLCHTHIK